MLKISWQWWVFAALVSAFLTLAYIFGPGPHPRLGGLFLVAFMLVRSIVKRLEGDANPSDANPSAVDAN